MATDKSTVDLHTALADTVFVIGLLEKARAWDISKGRNVKVIDSLLHQCEQQLEQQHEVEELTGDHQAHVTG